jgi:ribosomal protein S18 acetylase RimI-like enzyme
VSHSTPGRPEIGTTVTLRVATPVGPISVVGEVLEADAERWSVRRRDGSVTVVEVASIEAQRVVPPGKAQRASAAEVEQAAALGWRALETARLGDWLLRASGGFTKRANSALATGDPGQPLEDAITTVEAWYAERGLPARVQAVDGTSDPALAGHLAQRGWVAQAATHVMTGEIAHSLRALAAGSHRVDLADAPDDDWIACYARVGNEVSDLARALLTNHPQAIFASVRDRGEVVAIARSAVDHKWAGLFAVEVVPEHRRRGLGAAVSVGALREAGRRGARQVYLQCTADNVAAVALYQRLSLKIHHGYRYFAPPG